jgi:quercetin dioxygenase-like cupin family protein
VPHAARSGIGGKMLMFYAPGGFDEMLAEIDSASWIQRINPIANARRNRKYDIYQVKGDATKEASAGQGGLVPKFLAPGDGQRVVKNGNDAVIKLTSDEAGGLAELAEVVIGPGGRLAPMTQPDHARIIYLLNGTADVKTGDDVKAVQIGTTVFFPPGKQFEVTSTTGATLLVLDAPYRTR